MRVLLPVFLIFPLVQGLTCARILGIFHSPVYSHFTLGETIFKELAARGHNMTVVSAFPQKEKITNYTDVPLTLVRSLSDSVLQLSNFKEFLDNSAITFIKDTYNYGNIVTDLTLQDQSVQELLQSNESFDLIILEQCLNEAHFGFMHHFKAPVILVSPTIQSFWTNNLMGNPTAYALVPQLSLNLSPKMNIWQRAWNAFVTIFQSVYFHTFALPEQDNIMHKYFPDAPPITELIYNASLLLLNTNPAIGSPIPLLPNMIEIGGFHAQRQKQQSLTKELKKYLDEANEGVVYFSMGSILHSQNLDKEILQHILKTFAKLKMKVLWKWESEDLPGKPINVRIEKWLPQQAVLAHKNVKVFITHGGKLSATEAIYYGKPVLGMPIIADGYFNIQEAVYLGYGRHISYQTLTEEILTETLTDLIENPKYAEEAKRRSNAIRNFKVSPLDNAVNWIEYVIENKGAPHLRSEVVYLPWYQYILLDVILVVLVAIWLVTKIFSSIFLNSFRRTRRNKQKIN